MSEFLDKLRKKRSEGLSSLLALDPGATTGWAFFQDGLLEAAGYVKSTERFYYKPKKTLNVRSVLIELPQERHQGGKKTDVRSIITLAVRVGELKREWESRGAQVELVWPTTWKGSVPKKIHNRRVLAALSKAERALLPLRPRAKDHDHNMLDAVGEGLWKLGRM